MSLTVNKTAISKTLQRFANLPILVFPFIFTLSTLVLTTVHLESISWSILGIGFLTIGLSHGALDHLTQNNIGNKNKLFHFVTHYLLKSALFGVVWLLFSDLALIVFVAYSAWHFGQADFNEWGIRKGWQSLLWGIVVLTIILFFHRKELTWILGQIPNLYSTNILKKMTDLQLLSLQVFCIVCAITMAVVYKSKQILFTFTYLLLSSFLPLLVSFGIYFIGQHSMYGWRHLLVGLNESSSRLWLKSLPFSIAGALVLLSVALFSGANHIGIFFILLSCLSIPHAFSMHLFYAKLKLK